MLVNEIFTSIDGEQNGFRGAGELSTFVRLQGCNLHCSWCDTPCAIASEDEMACEMSVQEVYNAVKDSKKLTITGGEPLLQAEEVFELCSSMHRLLPITVETNGAIDLRPYLHMGRVADNIHLVVDFKMPSSGMQEHMHLESYSLLATTDIIKFVINNLTDYNEARRVSDDGKRWNAQIVFSPSKTSTKSNDLEWAKELASLMIEDRLWKVQFGLQIHKMLGIK